MTLPDLQKEAHAIAVEKGWWPEDKCDACRGEGCSQDETHRPGDFDTCEVCTGLGKTQRDPDEVYACLHEECSEAWREYCSGRPLTAIYNADMGGSVPWCNDDDEDKCKPTGFMVEVGDIVIRAADAAEAWGMKPKEYGPEEYQTNLGVAEFITSCHYHTTTAWGEHHTPKDCTISLSYLILKCFSFAAQHKVDLWKVIQLKMAYNRTRETKHGRIA